MIKLPRGRGLRLSGPELFRIALTLAMLIAVVVLTKPCSNAVSTFVMGMDGSGQGSKVRKPGAIDPTPHSHAGSAAHAGSAGVIETPAQPSTERGPPDEVIESNNEPETPDPASDRYELLKPGMTEREVRSAIERAKAKAASPNQTAPSPKPTPTDHGLE